MNINKIYNEQKAFFNSGQTLPYSFRQQMLKKLYLGLINHQEAIFVALQQDLGKGMIESILSEFWMVITELKYHLKHLKKWMKKKKVKTPLFLKPGKSYLLDSPLGVNLIISPWNYPFQLTILPLVGAISAGNTAIIKPSSQSSHTSLIIKQICDELFPNEYITCLLGEHDITNQLLEKDFDHIFFTGSVNIGKMIMAKAAKNLTKVTLELGGKSPAIIHSSSKIKYIIPRLIFGKWLNVGQTCVAPDYLICHESLFDEVISLLKTNLKLFYSNPLTNEDYPKIISKRHFERLISLIKPEELKIGGKFDENSLKIEPTVIRITDLNSPLLEEEIFGPILPIITYQFNDDLKTILNLNPYPLAFYVFSEDYRFTNNIINNYQFGGASINDTLSHITSSNLPFGGIKTSGHGKYHGYQSFKCFSHQKSLYQKHPRRELKLKYPPYSVFITKVIKKYFTK